MKVASNAELTSYIIKLDSEEAFELSEFLHKFCRAVRPDGRPALEVQVINGLYEEGLSKRYHEKWKKEYGLDDI